MPKKLQNDSPTSEPYFVLESPTVEVPTSFDSHKDLSSWIDDVIEWSKWITELPKAAAPVDRAKGLIQSSCNALSNSLPHLPNDKEGNHRRDLHNHLQTRIASRHLVLPSSRFGQLLTSIQKRDAQLASWTLAYWVSCNSSNGINPHQNIPEFIAGGFEYLAFERGLTDQTSEKQYLQELFKEWQKALSEQHATSAEQSKVFSELIESTRQQAEADKTTAEEQRRNHADEMEKIRSEFRDELAVHSAVKYWEQKHDDHRSKSHRWGAFVFLAFLLGLFGLPWLFTWLQRDVVNLINAASEASRSIQVVPLIIAASLKSIGITILFIWLVRILVRHYMSHVHLASDAAERRVIIQTYLALIKDPDVTESDELKKQVLPAALENIFRHTPDGIVKDDAMPLHAIRDALRS